VKRILWLLSAYAMGHEAYLYQQQGSTLLLTVFFLGTVSAIAHAVTPYPWQRS
jgi:hypothetical protein